jgi:RNA polymerase primary sigma factor
MNNSLRDHSADRKFHDRCSSNLEDTSFNEKMDEKESYAHYEYEEQESLHSDVGKILENLKSEFPRELFVLKNYYGIGQSDRKTLKEISEEMNLTKERVRQLRENAIAYIKKQVENGNLNLSSIF